MWTHSLHVIEATVPDAYIDLNGYLTMTVDEGPMGLALSWRRPKDALAWLEFAAALVVEQIDLVAADMSGPTPI